MTVLVARVTPSAAWYHQDDFIPASPFPGDFTLSQFRPYEPATKLAIASGLSGTLSPEMLAELFTWWTEQMRDLAAPLARGGSARSKDALLLTAESGVDEIWHVIRRRKGIATRLATLSPGASDAAWREAFASRRRGEPVVIRLSQAFLRRRTTLPIAADANLDRLLRYEMDRLTPFVAQDVLFSHHVASRDIARGTLLVDIAMVPKSWVRDLLERLSAMAIRPAALEESADVVQPDFVPTGDGSPGAPDSRSDQAAGWISLDHADPDQRARARLAWRAGTGACVALAAAAVVVPFVRQSIALAAVEDQIAELRPRMDQLDALRHRGRFGGFRTPRGGAGARRARVAHNRGADRSVAGRYLSHQHLAAARPVDHRRPFDRRHQIDRRDGGRVATDQPIVRSAGGAWR
jgi:hypothetical protein